MPNRLFIARVVCICSLVAACGSASSTPAVTQPQTATLTATAAPTTLASQTAVASAIAASPSASATASPAPSPAVTLEPSAPPATPAASASAAPGGLGDMLAALAGAKTWLHAPGTVRLDLRMTGTFDAGTKDYPWLVDLTDSQITADFDLTQGSGRIQVRIPGMDGFTEDILVIDQVEFARSSLGGNIWTRQQANGSIGSLGKLLRDPTGAVLAGAIATGAVSASMAADSTFQGTAAHQVTLAVLVADTYDIEAFVAATLGSKVGSQPQSGGLAGATKSLPIELFLATDDLRPLGLQLSMAAGASDPTVAGNGTVSIEGTFSRPSGTLSIKAPDKFVNATNPFDPPH